MRALNFSLCVEQPGSRRIWPRGAAGQLARHWLRAHLTGINDLRTHPLSTITTSRGILNFHFLAPVYWRFNQEETGWSNLNIRRHFILSALNLDTNTNGGQWGELVLSLWSTGGAFCFPVSPLRDVVFSGVSINAVLLTWNKMGGLADWAGSWESTLHYTNVLPQICFVFCCFAIYIG